LQNPLAEKSKQGREKCSNSPQGWGWGDDQQGERAGSHHSLTPSPSPHWSGQLGMTLTLTPCLTTKLPTLGGVQRKISSTAPSFPWLASWTQPLGASALAAPLWSLPVPEKRKEKQKEPAAAPGHRCIPHCRRAEAPGEDGELNDPRRPNQSRTWGQAPASSPPIPRPVKQDWASARFA
jgi:hypothetical protein